MSLLDVQQVASELMISPQWVRKLIKNGEIRAEKIGRQWVIDSESLNEYKSKIPVFQNICSDFDLEKPVFLSFFSGAMGLDQGLEKAGFSPRLFCESDLTCQRTIKKNRPNVPLIGDIWKYTAEEIRKISGLHGKIDLIAGGPPCQAFSTAGARKGFADIRGNVFLHYVDLLIELSPNFIVIENVRGLLSASLDRFYPQDSTRLSKLLRGRGGALLYILEKLRSAGYNISFDLYNAANFGVPQIRERVVLLGCKEGSKMPYLCPTHSEDEKFGLPKWNTLKKAISDLTQCHHLSFAEKRLKCYRMLKEGQYWKDLPQEVRKEAMGKNLDLGGGKTGFYRRLSWNKPSCTLVTSPIMPATDICHPTEDRPLSIEEYKRIQMFPDDWSIEGTLTQQYRQIGNAVPIGLGESIGRTILSRMARKDDIPPANFSFSRYRNTDDASWEAETRGLLGLEPNESLLDLVSLNFRKAELLN